MNRSVSLKKLTLDFAMVLVIASIYSKNVVSLMYHEVAGLILIVLFLVHIGFNHRFLSRVTPRVFRGETPLRTKLLWILNVLLIISWAAVGVSGILISKKLFSFGMNALIPWHFFSAALSLALTGLHIGFHWDYLGNWIHRLFPVTSYFKKVMKFLTAAAVIYGCVVLFTGNVGTWASAPFRSRTQGHSYATESSNQASASYEGSRNTALSSEDHQDTSPSSEDRRQASSSSERSSERSSGSSHSHAAQPFSPLKLLQLALNISCVLLFFAFLEKSIERLSESKRSGKHRREKEENKDAF